MGCSHYTLVGGGHDTVEVTLAHLIVLRLENKLHLEQQGRLQQPNSSRAPNGTAGSSTHRGQTCARFTLFGQPGILLCVASVETEEEGLAPDAERWAVFGKGLPLIGLALERKRGVVGRSAL